MVDRVQRALARAVLAGLLLALLGERTPDLVTIEGWRAIDAHERGRGQEEQRPRVKLASREELLAAAVAR